jgi:hypothetical protein
MLFSPLPAAAELLYASTASGTAAVTPQDPSSFTLALIGAGTLGIYLALHRGPRPAAPPRTRPYGKAISTKMPAIEQESSRGAA